MARLNATNLFSLLWKNGWLVHSVRTAVGATASLCVARLLDMPEPYWAAIATLTVMQSTLGASWPVSKQRFIGTALGAAVGGMLASYFEPRIIVFGAGIFVLGLICAILHLDQSAYRFSGITLTIVMLVVRGNSPELIAVHRFIEVSMGIAAALALSALWKGPDLPS